MKVLPHITPFGLEEEVNRGETVQLTCLVNRGDMPVKFKWYLNGEPIEKFQDISVIPVGKKTSLLNIDAADEVHVGNYTCTARNRAGTSSYSTEITVKGTT